MDQPCVCGSTIFQETGFGLNFCVMCGLGVRGSICNTTNNIPYCSSDRTLPKQSYTRLKRFKKYLFRAMRMQHSSSVPQETWEYLLARVPFRNAAHVQRTLKQARTLRRKCYDSLPMLTDALCPHITVPRLSEQEKQRAIGLFHRIDRAVKTRSFISYLYCLEYILLKMGRGDMVEHINRIQCPKRRETYREMLDGIFAEPRLSVTDRLKLHAVHPSKSLHREVPPDPAFAPDCLTPFEVTLLTGYKPGGGDVAGTARLGHVGLDEDLVEKDVGFPLSL